jgi:hypothetical protein
VVERATGIGGVFVRSPRPDALRAWYAQHLGLELLDFGAAVLRSNGGETLTWAVFPDDTDYFGPHDQQVMVNYRVRDLDAILAQLRAAGCGRGTRIRSVRLGDRSRRQPLRALGAAANQ